MASLRNLDIPFYPKYFKLINFNSVKKSNFNLPTNILSPEIVKAVNAKHSNKNKRKRSAAAAKRTNKKNNNYASSIDSYKIPKQKKVKINLDEEQIKSLPVQEKYPPYPANEYVFTPHIKETTPSVLVRHPQRLDAIQIQHDFEERTIMDNISMLLQAVELIEDKNKLEEITNRYNETKRIRDLLAIASVDIKKKKSIEERLHKIEEEKKVAEEELASLTNTTTS
ncbi:4722_t:CDS:2 [Entrophospora sp. SA101]|nr:4722_t:CDS:2 [Entrophospora sp. SA101]CAJ0849088.1 11980_t:CDS:2 [Entrophospora sp. SA101]